MAYSRITNTRDGKAAIRYAFEEPSHKKGMDRVLSASGSNLDPDFAMQQMSDTWKRFGKDKGDYVQMYRVIQSFGLDELDPNNPEHVDLANQMGQEFAQELYPDRQALIVTQADGEGGKLHNHVLVNSVSHIDGKSLRGKRTGFVAVAEATNEVMRRHGFNPEPVPNGTRDKTTIAERKLADKGEYVWKDDLKHRIRQGMAYEGVTSHDEYIKHMEEEHGVNVRFRGNAKDADGNKIKGISYDFMDEDGKKRTSRASTLGLDYQSDVLDSHIEQNIEVQKQSTPDIEKVSPVDEFDFDVQSALDDMFKPKKVKKRKVTSSSMADDITERIEKRRLHDEALKMNAEFDEQRAEQERQERAEQSRLEQLEKEKQEREEAEAKRQREEQERQEQAEKQRKEQQKREDEERQGENERRYAELAYINTPFLSEKNKHLKNDKAYLDYFKENYEDMKDKRNPLSQQTYTLSEIVDTVSSRYSRLQDEKQGQTHQQVVIEQNEPDLEI